METPLLWRLSLSERPLKKDGSTDINEFLNTGTFVKREWAMAGRRMAGYGDPEAAIRIPQDRAGTEG